MKILIMYEQRLGDVIRIFPAARHFAKQGHEVFIECFPQYHEIFDCISYAKPIAETSMRGTVFDKVYRPQIWPQKYDAFRASGKTWMDFVYSLYPEWAEIDREIVFDRLEYGDLPEYNLPEDYCLLFPFAMSSKVASLACLFREVTAHMDINNTYLFMSREQRAALVGRGFEPSRAMAVKHLSHLPRLVRDAKQVMTVNTSTTIIASVVRRQYYHIADPNFQDNHTHPSQTVLHV